LSAQRCRNLFAEAAPADAKSTVDLLGTPGLTAFTTVGTGPIRLLWEMAGVLYAVSRDQLYTVTSTGTATLIGTLAGQERTDYRLDAADNGTQLAIVNSGTGAASVYNRTTNTLSAIADPDFPDASSVAYIDGYLVFTRLDSGQWFTSELLDAASYNSLDFASAESHPDFLVKVLVDHREVWLFGARSVEVWTNTGAADFPFQRLSGGILERGCGAAGSVAKIDNSIFWLGDDRVFYRAAGYQPQRISHHAIEYALEHYAVVSDAEAFVHSMEGHQFYTVTFPGAGVTWCYDVASGLWHERESRDDEGRSLGRWRVSAYARCYDQHIVGDFQSGALYRMDLDEGMEAGNVIVREAVSPPIAANGHRITMSRLEIDLETGIGRTSGQGSNPNCMLQWSDDGGRSWSNEHWASMGQIGQYKRRVRWHRIGQFRERYFRLVIADPVKVSILGANAEMERGLS
jgi:hypothetical protein